MIFPLYDPTAASLLSGGKIGIIPTETIYGICTSAYNKDSVEQIFAIKKRPDAKPFAVLVADIQSLDAFGIAADAINQAAPYWPGRYTIVLPNSDPKWEYLHRNSGGISFRIPADAQFRSFLSRTGPLATSSANISDMNPVASPDEAASMFGENVEIIMQPYPWASKKPSTVLSLIDGNVTVLRP